MGRVRTARKNLMGCTVPQYRTMRKSLADYAVPQYRAPRTSLAGYDLPQSRTTHKPLMGLHRFSPGIGTIPKKSPIWGCTGFDGGVEAG